jgi:uncharacterized surface protein with fasciclin (FAS1) repeats
MLMFSPAIQSVKLLRSRLICVSKNVFFLSPTLLRHRFSSSAACCSTILCENIQTVGLDAILSVGSWTVFAPTNSAFLALPPGFVEEITADPDDLSELLLFHAVSGEVILGTDLGCADLITMANGDESRTSCGGNGSTTPTHQKGAGNPDGELPSFVQFNFAACNGVIHKLDGVMLFETFGSS